MSIPPHLRAESRSKLPLGCSLKVYFLPMQTDFFFLKNLSCTHSSTRLAVIQDQGKACSFSVDIPLSFPSLPYASSPLEIEKKEKINLELYLHKSKNTVCLILKPQDAAIICMYRTASALQRLLVRKGLLTFKVVIQPN